MKEQLQLFPEPEQQLPSVEEVDIAEVVSQPHRSIAERTGFSPNKEDVPGIYAPSHSRPRKTYPHRGTVRGDSEADGAKERVELQEDWRLPEHTRTRGASQVKAARLALQEALNRNKS